MWLCLNMLTLPSWYHIPSSLPVLHCRCPWLTRAVSPAIPVYNGILFLFVLANFSMATFMDPGVFPRGRALCGAAYPLCSRVIVAGLGFPVGGLGRD